MSGIHRSQEVYKFTPTNSGMKLVPVQGLYVSGLHTEPWYIDHCITISRFTSTDATIRDYYDSQSTLPFNGIHLVGLESLPVKYQKYTSVARQETFSGIHLVGINSLPVQINKYTSQNISKTFSGIHLVGIMSYDVTAQNFYILKRDSSLEHIVSVTQYTTTEPTISNTLSMSIS